MTATSFDQKKFVEFLNQPSSQRNERWEKDFLDQLPYCFFSLISDAPQVGPDQFPYMYVEINEDSTTPIFQILNWIYKAGVGLAVNPKKQFPDFVLTYGMIWNFIKNGQFISQLAPPAHIHGPDCNHDSAHTDKNDVSIQPGSTFYVGEPSEAFLPVEIRNIVKEFLKQQGVMAPKVIMLSQDQKNFDLCFSAESFGSPDPKEYEGILQALSWFLPAHYSLAMVSEKDLPSFFEL